MKNKAKLITYEKFSLLLNNFQLRVKELLEEEGITQKKLAEMAGVRESTISDIVRGTRTVINFEHLGKIATALEISDIRKIIDLEKV